MLHVGLARRMSRFVLTGQIWLISVGAGFQNALKRLVQKTFHAKDASGVSIRKGRPWFHQN